MDEIEAVHPSVVVRLHERIVDVRQAVGAVRLMGISGTIWPCEFDPLRTVSAPGNPLKRIVRRAVSLDDDDDVRERSRLSGEKRRDIRAPNVSARPEAAELRSAAEQLDTATASSERKRAHARDEAGLC